MVKRYSFFMRHFEIFMIGLVIVGGLIFASQSQLFQRVEPPASTDQPVELTPEQKETQTRAVKIFILMILLLYALGGGGTLSWFCLGHILGSWR